MLLQNDGEPSIVACTVQTATAAGVEGVPREFPVGDHQGNGCKEIKMHIRVGRSALGEKLGQPLGDTDPMLAWIAERTLLKAGRYIGHHGRMETLLLMRDSGVMRGQGIRRLSPGTSLGGRSK